MRGKPGGNRLTVFGCADGTVHLKCRVCKAAGVVSPMPQCSVETLRRRADQFEREHARCKTRTEVVRENLAAGLKKNGEARDRTSLRRKVVGVGGESWKTIATRAYERRLASGSLGPANPDW